MGHTRWRVEPSRPNRAPLGGVEETRADSQSGECTERHACVAAGVRRATGRVAGRARLRRTHTAARTRGRGAPPPRAARPAPARAR